MHRQEPDGDLTEACNQWYELAQKELARFNKYQGKTPVPGWDLLPSDYVDDQNGRKFICLAKRDLVDGRRYEVQLDRRNHTTTFIVHGNDEDRAAGLVGTDNRAVIKMMNASSYDFIKSDDFIDRVNMIYEAAFALAEVEKKHLSTVDYDALQANLQKDRLYSLQILRSYCDFHTIDHAIRYSQTEANKDTTKIAHEKFGDAYEIALAVVRTSIEKCSRHIESSRIKHAEKPDVAEIREQLKHKEVELLSERGRPFDIKVRQMDTFGSPAKMVSAQMPLGAKTLTSTNRTGEDPATKLSNHVRDYTGVINLHDKIEKKLVVDGHCSYSPLQQKDGPLRVYYSYQAAREKVLQLARDQLAANPDLINKGIDINLTTLSLLSPLKSEKLDKFGRGKASEYMQLKDIRTALNILMHGPALTLQVDGAEIPVRLNSTHMNLAVNSSGFVLEGLNPQLQMDINAKGFVEFKRNLAAQIPALLDMKDTLNDDGQNIVYEIEAYHSKSPRGQERYRDAVNYLDSSVEEVKDVYRKWHSVLSDYANGVATKKDVIAVKKDAEKINDLQGKSYIKIEQSYTAIFNGGQNLKLSEKIHAYLRNNADLIPDPVRASLVCALHGLQAERRYHLRYNSRDDQAYDFHINYLLANYSFGQLVEFFCKSAEDRTGALRVKLLAHMMFQEIHGYPPKIEDGDLKELKRNSQEESDAEKLLKYMQFAHELSASLENTKHNSAARGLQVKELFTINGYNMKAGKLMAALAKGPYDMKPMTQKDLDKLLAEKEAKMLAQKQSGTVKATGVLGSLYSAIGSIAGKERVSSKERATASAAASPTASASVSTSTSTSSSTTSSAVSSRRTSDSDIDSHASTIPAMKTQSQSATKEPAVEPAADASSTLTRQRSRRLVVPEGIQTTEGTKVSPGKK